MLSRQHVWQASKSLKFTSRGNCNSKVSLMKSTRAFKIYVQKIWLASSGNCSLPFAGMSGQFRERRRRRVTRHSYVQHDSEPIRHQFGIDSGSISDRFGVNSGSVRVHSGSIWVDSGSNGQTAVRLDGRMAERPYGHMAERPNVAAGKKNCRRRDLSLGIPNHKANATQWKY